MYYVYILENNINKKWYVGYTSNLRKRMKEHNSGNGSKTTSRGVLILQLSDVSLWKLIYYGSYLNKKDAVGREIFLKSGSGHRFLKKQLFHYLKNN
jgi:putative endonuclease